MILKFTHKINYIITNLYYTCILTQKLGCYIFYIPKILTIQFQYLNSLLILIGIVFSHTPFVILMLNSVTTFISLNNFLMCPTVYNFPTPSYSSSLYIKHYANELILACNDLFEVD